MYARIVTFRLQGLTAAEYQDHAVAVAPAFTAWPGLLAKVWIADDDAGTYGGFYLFADRDSADRARDTDLFRSMAANPMFADLSVREFDVLDEPTATTGAMFAAGHAALNARAVTKGILMPSVATTTNPRVGLFPAALDQHNRDSEQMRATLAHIAEVGIDHLCVGDHVSFFVGAGSDGLISASALLAAQAELPVYVALYLLPLRHPVTVARQLATIAELAPGRLTLGIGIGGEDRHEVEICGVDPKTRGRRTDESLQILRGLAEGSSVTLESDLFSIKDALILPAPVPATPLIVGGRSGHAVSRAAELGDGWLGIWVSPRRYAVVTAEIAGRAEEVGRSAARFEHALNVWCGFGRTREAAREPLATQMAAFYQSRFELFERYSPFGTPEDVAESLRPYIEAGCSAFNVIPCAEDAETAITAVGELRKLLTST